MSAPATKALFPEPVIIIILQDLSFDKLSNAICNSFMVDIFSAFNLFGLLIVIVVTLSFVLTNMFSNFIFNFLVKL